VPIDIPFIRNLPGPQGLAVGVTEPLEWLSFIFAIGLL